jgi:anti-sigma regulatory factor (Ser/Thr protein kinase)
LARVSDPGVVERTLAPGARTVVSRCEVIGEMDLVVTGRGALTDYDFARHIAPSQPGRRRIDLSGARFVDPFGLVTIATLAERAVDDGHVLDFAAPEDGDCCRYLHRMGLAEVLEGLDVDHALLPVRRHFTGDRLLELRRFDADADAVDQLAEQVYRIFEDEGGAGTLYDAIDEVAQNVVEHSGSSGGWVALQQFARTAEVSFAVADSGVGLRSALSRKMTVRDDAHAIGLAVRRHVTSKEDEGGGVGLNSFVRHTRHGGRVRLLTGEHSGTFTRGRVIPRLTRHAAPFPGTVAQARLGVR